MLSLMVIASTRIVGPTQDSSEVVAHRLLQLLIAARLRIAVVAPALELGGMAKAPALHVVVLHLKHPLRSQRREAEVLAGAPATLGAGDAVGVGRQELAPPAPRVVLDRADQRLQLLDELRTPGLGEAGAHADVLQLAI